MRIPSAISGHTKAGLYTCGSLKGSETENKIKLCAPNGLSYWLEMERGFWVTEKGASVDFSDEKYCTIVR